jgi:hypothetical protein
MKKGNRIYLDPFSLLISTPKGIRRKYVPFSVITRENTGGLVKGKVYLVRKILTGDQDKLLFEVEGKSYLHSYFLIP